MTGLRPRGPGSETSAPQHSTTLGGEAIAGIAIGIAWTGLFFFIVGFLLRKRKARRTRSHALPPDSSRDPTRHRNHAYLSELPLLTPQDVPFISLELPTTTFPNPFELTTSSPHQVETSRKQHSRSFSAQGGLSKETQRKNYLSSARNRTFLAFLSSYSSGGISLRELIMLATLRQAKRESKNHWLLNGEAGTFEEATVISETGLKGQKSVFIGFVKDGVVDNSTIESFQEELEFLELIEVTYPKGTLSDEASQYWHTDERMWTVRGNEWNGTSAPIDDFAVLQDLLDLLIAMPDKDVSPAAQRQREIYHYHAHLLILRVIRSRRLLEKYPLLLTQAVFVVLQLLTHRYRMGDSLLLDFVRDNSVPSLYPNMDVMLLWAELKEKTFQEDYDGLCTIRDRALDLVNSNEVQSQAAPRLNGLLGFLLVDLMKSAKTFHFEDIVADAVKAGTKWADTAQTAQRASTSIEKTALCEVLATFNIHACNETILEEYGLHYGYHLSRAGFLVQGNQFLFRGLENRDLSLLWSYEMERVSNALRLGRLSEAARMLKSIRERALRSRDEGPSSILWKLSGQCAENFVLLNLYEADYSASTGRLDDACAKLESGIYITSSVYDAYIQILHVTMETRLLEILIWQGSLEEALPVALKLASVFLDEKTSSILAPDTVRGIVQQSLDLCNTLLSAGKVASSMALLKSITDVGSLLPDELSAEIESYVEQRMAKARLCSETIELSKNEQDRSTLNTGTEDTILVQTNTRYDPTTPKAKETTAWMNASLRPPSSSKTWETGIEDPITQVQTDPGYYPTVPETQPTKVLANASLDPNSSYQYPPRLPKPTKSQTKAQKRRERDKDLSSEAFQSKTYASTLGRLLRAPRPPSTEPDKHKSASGEKSMQQGEALSPTEVKPSAMVPGLP